MERMIERIGDPKFEKQMVYEFAEQQQHEFLHKQEMDRENRNIIKLALLVIFMLGALFIATKYT